jgi:PAS domain S-box-containing protein
MIIGVLVIHIFLTPLLFYGILLIVERNFQSQFVDQVRHDTFLYSSILKPVVEEGNEAKQAGFLEEILIGGNVVFAEFINSDGEVIRADSDTGEHVTDFLEDFSFGAHDDHIYYISIQLFGNLDGRSFDTLRLGYDEIPTENKISSAYGFGAILAVFYVVLSMLLVIFFGWRLIKPISDLRNTARSIADGDHSAGLNVRTNIREVRNLVNDLDIMRKNLLSKQNELIYREERLRAVLDNAGEGIISIDEKGIINSFNIAAESIFGYSADEVLGRNVSMLMPSPYREKHDEYINEYLRTGKAKVIGTSRRLQALRKDESLIPIQLSLGKVWYNAQYTFVGIIHDLSSEEEKDAQLKQLWRAVEQSPVTIMITDVKGQIQYVNPCFSRVTGYPASEVLGKNPRVLKSEQTPQEIYNQLWKTIANGGVWNGVFQNKKKNGEAFWVSATICPIRDQSGNITHYISINEDITDVRKKERMLAQAMKLEAIGRMTDGIAHDFNNLLTIIRGNLRLLQNDSGDADEDRELIEDALSAAQDGADQIKRLMAFSRRQDQNVKIIDINKSLVDMERILRRSVPDANIELDLTEDMEGALVDPNLLVSAILNLVTNARDAMPEGGRIIIATRKENVEDKIKSDADLPPGNYIALSVTDTGIGMSDDVRRMAIDPFFTTKTIETGSGLGLTMVNDFVQQSMGKLSIESTPGRGTTITLLFPSVEISDEWIIENEIIDDLPKGSETILVVEDMDKVRRFACRTLNHLGYSTYEAGDGDTAFRLLKNNENIELLFTDIVMPGKTNGRQLAHLALDMRPMLKVLLTTGMEPRNKKNKQDSVDLPLLQKPYSMEDLALTVREILDKQTEKQTGLTKNKSR